MNLSRFTELERQHIAWNGNPGHIREPILSIEATTIALHANFLPILIDVHGRGQSSQGSMIIMPSAPVILGLPFLLEREIMQDSPDMPIAS